MRRSITLALLLVLVAPAADAAAVRGRVTVPPAPPADARFKPYPGRASSLAVPERPQRGLVTDAVVYVDSMASEPDAPRPTERPKLAQRGQAFDPRVVVVPVGGTVDFPNLDPI